MKDEDVSLAVANEFLILGSQDEQLLTPMQLIKLCYIAHGWYLAFTSKELITEPIEVWKHGPVIPSIYHAFKTYGDNSIVTTAKFLPEPSSDYQDLDLDFEELLLPDWETDKKKVIRWVWKHYRKYDGYQLSQLTHKEDSPWFQARQQMLKKNSDNWQKHYEIPTILIKDYYTKLKESSLEPVRI